jgi:ligand-binding sensor domain-containing protein
MVYDFLKSLIILLATSISFCLQAQDDIKFSHITVNEDLANNTVNSVIRDSRGFLWIATENGLNRYNAYTFEHFNAEEPNCISSNITYAVYEDKAERVWLGSKNGLDLFNRTRGTFDTHFLKGICVRAVYQDSQRRLWVGSDSGVYLFNEEKIKFEKCFPEIYDLIKTYPNLYNTISSITEDDHENLWIGLFSSGVFVCNVKTKKNQHYYHNPEKQGSISNNNIRSIIKDKRGRMWIATYGGGVNLFQPETKTFKIFTNEGKPNGISNALITPLWEDVDGKIWIGTDGTGIDILDPDSETVFNTQHSYFNTKSLNCNVIRSIYSDNKGGVWVGTYSGGVNFFTRNTEAFFHYRVPVFNGNSVSAFAEEPTGNLWIGTDGGGLCYFNRSTEQMDNFLHNKKNKNSLSDNRVTSLILDHKHNVWIGTYMGGLCHFNSRTRIFKNYSAGDRSQISDNIIWILLQDSKRRIWVGTESGLNLFNPAIDKFKNYTTHNSALRNGIIRALFEDSKKRLWIGTLSGLYLYDEETDNFTLVKKVGVQDNLQRMAIKAINEDSHGNLVLGTIEHGVNIINIDNNTFTRYKEGLLFNQITGIMPDREDNLWVSTAKGLAMITHSRKEIKKYFANGGENNQFNVNAVYKTRRGEFLMGSKNGFRLFVPEVVNNVNHNPFPPQVALTSFKLLNKEVMSGEGSLLQKHINETKEITLSYDKSVITFEFAALNFIEPQKNSYAYRLLGFEDNWNYIESNVKNDIKNKRSCTYTNLEPGHYTLELKASNNAGEWNENPLQVQITITPPFWKTSWFKVMVGFIAIVILMIIINIVRRRIVAKIKINRVIADLKMKALMAQMNPHFIFNSLTSIQELILVNKHDEGMYYLEQFSKLLRIALQSSDKSFIPLTLEVTLLNLYLELEAMRFSQQFHYEVNVESSIDIDEITIPTFLIQPFVENAIWHGLMPKKGDRTVIISFKVKGKDALICRIKDNGIGRVAAAKIGQKKNKMHQSMGLKITRERIELMKRQNSLYDLEIIDETDASGEAIGTTVMVTLPLWLDADGHQAEDFNVDRDMIITNRRK